MYDALKITVAVKKRILHSQRFTVIFGGNDDRAFTL